MVQFEKHHGRIRPQLHLEDSIQVKLHSTEVIGQDNLVLTFAPADVIVGQQNREEEVEAGHQLTSSFLAPEININLAQVEKGDAKPWSQGLENRNLKDSTFSDTIESSRSSSDTNGSSNIFFDCILTKITGCGKMLSTESKRTS